MPPPETTPLVTVITPVYNTARYIRETVESILAQTYSNIEYICIDDGSIDDSHARMKPYAEAGRIRLYRHDNMGESATVNEAVSLARGTYIGIVNADDPVRPTWASRAVEMLEARPELAAVYPDYQVIDPDGKVLRSYQFPYDYRVLVEQHLCLPGPGAVVRKSMLGGEPFRDPGLLYKSDYYLWLRLGARHPIARIPDVLATWREHAASASVGRRGRQMAEEHVGVMERFFTRADCPSPVKAWKPLAMSVAFYAAALQGLHAVDVPARQYLLTSFRLAPVWPAYFVPERRRAWSRIIYLLGLPFTRWLYRAVLKLRDIGGRS